jgi:hypothetical protein
VQRNDNAPADQGGVVGHFDPREYLGAERFEGFFLAERYHVSSCAGPQKVRQLPLRNCTGFIDQKRGFESIAGSIKSRRANIGCQQTASAKQI